MGEKAIISLFQGREKKSREIKQPDQPKQEQKMNHCTKHRMHRLLKQITKNLFS